MYWLRASPRWLVLRNEPEGAILSSLRKLRGPTAREADLEGEAALMEAVGSEPGAAEASANGFGALLRKESKFQSPELWKFGTLELRKFRHFESLEF